MGGRVPRYIEAMTAQTTTTRPVTVIDVLKQAQQLSADDRQRLATRLRVDALPQSTGILPDTPGALKRHLDQSRREAAEHPERLVPMDQFEHQMRSKLAAL